MLNPKIIEIIKNGTSPQRVYACSKSFPAFALYYFTEYFTFKIAPFHWDFYDDCQKLVDNKLKEVAWIAFRESSKTSIAKMFITWCIVYKKKHYINYDSYDSENAENALFDIAVTLQTNKKILQDFGQLYFATKSGEAERETKVKRKGNFVTENKVKVEAFSTQVPIRGRIYRNFRPDLVVLDDIENNKTKDSMPAILSIRGHIDEMRTGLPEQSSVLYLGNLITEDGVIAYVMELLKNRDNAIVRDIPVVIDGKPTWEDKYVMTDKEAFEANKNGLVVPKISIEAKRRELTEPVFQAEMMNNPAKTGDHIFDREVIENKKRLCYEPKEIDAGLKIWFPFNPSHRYAIGADTSEGIGQDSCASVIIDFSTTPNKVVATYDNSYISPDLFGYELVRQGNLYGKSFLAPELNGTGYATVAVVGSTYPESKIFHHTLKDKITNVETKKMGWHTNTSTKSSAIYELKSAVEDGDLEIYDLDLLNELKFYQIRNLRSKKMPGMTRHFDKLMALAITWQMRDKATPNTNPQKMAEIQKVRQERRNEYF